MMYFWLFASVTLASLLMTAGLRRYALARSIIDIPNARSSHSIPTPRGGGVAIVVAFLLTLPLLGQLGLVPPHYLIALGGAGALVAIVGFMDDHGHIAARWRLLGHFSAAIWALAWLEGLAPLNLFGVSVDLSWIGHALAAFYLVWVLNLYNFMDGIDGIASIEAVSACLGASALYILSGFTDLIWPPLILAAAVLGFLFWNFPPAKIFMGGRGQWFPGDRAWDHVLASRLGLSGLVLGMADPAGGVYRRRDGHPDSAVFLRGDKVYEAHRSHAYQFASRRYGRHRPVTMAVAAINVLWLFPLAWCVVVLKLDGLTGVVLAYVPLVILAFKFKAGQLEDA
nr:glycosyltransferase family 4 protein [Pseudomonas brassicacearum subsp. brassicacearum]